MAKPLTRDQLIETSLRRALIPSDQATFTCSDITDIFNEEIGIHVLPNVLKAHEEYYVIDEDVCLCTCTVNYRIPYRAVGNKLRDVSYVDAGGNVYEMTRITLDDRVDDYCSYHTNFEKIRFYVENDEIVLINRPTTGKLRMSYYLRPNELVDDDRIGVVTAVTNQLACVTITSYANLPGDTITVAGVTFTATACAVVSGAATFQAATSNVATACSLATQINANSTASALVTASVACSIVTITANAISTQLSVSYSDNCCSVGATVSSIKKKFTMSNFPTHFCTTCTYDIIQGKSPNKIIVFDKNQVSVCSTAKTIEFLASDLKVVDPRTGGLRDVTLSVGDHIAKAEETKVPQLPTELHPIIAQRTAVKMLEALGDTEGMQTAQKELERMEYNSMTLIDNRVEGSPQKVLNRNSILRQGINRRRR